MKKCFKCRTEMVSIQDKPIENGIKRCLECPNCGLEDTEYKYFKE